MNAWVLDKAKPLGQILVEQGALGSRRTRSAGGAGAEAPPAARRRRRRRAWPRSARSGRLRDEVAADRRPRRAGQPGAACRRRARPMTRRHPPALGRHDRPRPAGVSASCGRTPRAAWARCSWPTTRSCTARWPSRRSRNRYADHPPSRARFLLEAEITGGLEHPGIVPVYGLGSYADGRPFYAMRFIKGDSLKDAIERFHQADVPAATPASGRWRCGNCWAGSWTSATPSPTPTAAACCTAT